MFDILAGTLTGGSLYGWWASKRAQARIDAAAQGHPVTITVFFSRQPAGTTVADLPVVANSKLGLHLEQNVLSRAGGHPQLLGGFGAFWDETLTAAQGETLPVCEYGDRIQFLRPVPDSPHGSLVALEMLASDWSLVRRLGTRVSTT